MLVATRWSHTTGKRHPRDQDTDDTGTTGPQARPDPVASVPEPLSDLGDLVPGAGSDPAADALVVAEGTRGRRGVHPGLPGDRDDRGSS